MSNNSSGSSEIARVVLASLFFLLFAGLTLISIFGANEVIFALTALVAGALVGLFFAVVSWRLAGAVMGVLKL